MFCSLLATIPASDLGESLDCRPAPPRPLTADKAHRSAPGSAAASLESGDSGYEEYDEEGAHIITEHSEAGQVGMWGTGCTNTTHS